MHKSRLIYSGTAVADGDEGHRLIEPVGAWTDYQQSRIRSYRFEAFVGSDWVVLVSGGSPSPTTILRLTKPITAKKLRLIFEALSPEPHIAEVGIYNEPG
jgi:alpha-L-fucosidase